MGLLPHGERGFKMKQKYFCIYCGYVGDKKDFSKGHCPKCRKDTITGEKK
jgi:rubrerythrin